jgi:hypothetical protein
MLKLEILISDAPNTFLFGHDIKCGLEAEVEITLAAWPSMFKPQ